MGFSEMEINKVNPDMLKIGRQKEQKVIHLSNLQPAGCILKTSVFSCTCYILSTKILILLEK